MTGRIAHPRDTAAKNTRAWDSATDHLTTTYRAHAKSALRATSVSSSSSRRWLDRVAAQDGHVPITA